MREALKNHINDILNDEPVLPREIAVEKYTDALMQFFSTEHAAQVEAYQAAIKKIAEQLKDAGFEKTSTLIMSDLELLTKNPTVENVLADTPTKTDEQIDV